MEDDLDLFQAKNNFFLFINKKNKNKIKIIFTRVIPKAHISDRVP